MKLADIIMMVGGIAKNTMADPSQTERMVDIALDGLRYKG